MIFDLTALLQGTLNKIDIDQEFSFPEEQFQESEILGLEFLKVKARFSALDERSILLEGTLSGTMFLEDSISLEEISYPFSTHFEEKLIESPENMLNAIDIMDILWQNIMLEVPLQLTEVQDLSQYRGDGWKLVSEEEIRNKNNPFQELKDILGEE